MNHLIYLIGIPIAYLTVRGVFISLYGEWTTSDRLKGVIVSFGSFATVLIALVQYFICYESNKKSNW